MARSDEEEPETYVEHPNRDKAASKVTRLVVVVLLLASAFLLAVITWGGWKYLVGAKPLEIAYIIIFVVLAFFVLRWSRGVLPLAAALGIVLLIFAAVSAPGWYERDKTGYASPTLNASLLGLLTFLLIPLEILLIAFSMRGFQQSWNVEVEKPVADDGGGRGDREDRGEPGEASPAPA
jgi:presenilin-like A22 family membrane protease